MNVNTTSNISTHPIEATNNVAGEYLAFTLGEEGYALEILKVQEIRGYDSVTKIANTPDFIKGVVNLRGKIVPIVDLRIKFHLDKVEYDEFTVVIILNLNGRVVGIVVDGVSDVMALKDEQIRDVPSLVSSIDTRHIVGLATVEEQMFILINIEKMMNSQEMSLVDNAIVH
jgi:purine-binding chemotaxis protein CheW